MTEERPLLTNSVARLFGECQEKYRLHHLSRLRPKVEAPALRFGTLWHDLLMNHYRAMRGEDRPEAQWVIDRWVDDYRFRVEHYRGESPVDVDKVTELEQLVLGMWPRYLAEYADDAERWEILDVERPFRFPLRRPCPACQGDVAYDPMAADADCLICKGLGLSPREHRWDFGGKIDLIVRNRDDRGIYIVEHKTTIERTPDAYAALLAMDPQPRGYLWAVQQMYGDVAGIIYNVARKKVPREPSTTKCVRCARSEDGRVKCRTCKGKGYPCKTCAKSPDGRVRCAPCKGKGYLGPKSRVDICDVCAGAGSHVTCPDCKGTGQSQVCSECAGVMVFDVCPDCNGSKVGGISKQAADTTLDLFDAVLSRYPHLNPDDYRERTDELRDNPSTFFFRSSHYVSPRDLCQWEVEHARVATTMDHTHHYGRNLRACRTFSRCAFWELCLERSQAALENYERVEGNLPHELVDDEPDV